MSRRPVVIALAIAGTVILVVALVVMRIGGSGPNCSDVRFGTAASQSSVPRSPLAGISGVGARLRVALGSGPREVAYCNDFADPFVLRVGHRYYAYSTNTGTLHIPVMRVAGFFDSGRRHDALPTLPPWAKPGATWAPSVLAVAGRYVMYYTTTVAVTDAQCLSRAVATTPDGPFTDTSTGPWICPHPGGAIDPSPVATADGHLYLTWKSFDGFTGIVAAELSTDGLQLTSPTRNLLAATLPWEGGTVEAPALVATTNGYRLFYSGGDWRTAGYAVGAARCVSPLGPCTKVGDQPLIASIPKAVGPGGEEVFTDDKGHDWLVLHAWVNGRAGYPDGARGLFVVPLSITGPQPFVGRNAKP